MGRYNEALADLDRAIQLNPEDDWFRYQRALALHCRGDTVRAVDEIESAVAMVTETLKSANFNHHDAYNIGVYFAALRDYEGARNTFRNAILAFPNALDTWEAICDLNELCTVPGMDAAAVELLIGLLSDGNASEAD
jgi:tetratricopeptide (TPR) repeat protein